MNAFVDISGARIETERIILRPWCQEDLEDFYGYACVDGVGQMAGWQPHESLEESQTILDMFIREKNVFALELKESGKVIGSLGLEPQENRLGIPETMQGREIGYVLSKDYWGRGLMPEAVHGAIDYCFRRLGFDYLLCGHFIWNNQSRRVVEKCGFRFLQNIPYKTQYGTEELTRMYILYREESHA